MKETTRPGHVHFRVTDAERDLIDAAADLALLARSAYLRQTVLRRANADVVLKPAPAPAAVPAAKAPPPRAPAPPREPPAPPRVERWADHIGHRGSR